MRTHTGVSPLFTQPLAFLEVFHCSACCHACDYAPDTKTAAALVTQALTPSAPTLMYPLTSLPSWKTDAAPASMSGAEREDLRRHCLAKRQCDHRAGELSILFLTLTLSRCLCCRSMSAPRCRWFYPNTNFSPNPDPNAAPCGCCSSRVEATWILPFGPKTTTTAVVWRFTPDSGHSQVCLARFACASIRVRAGAQFPRVLYTVCLLV